GGHHGYRAGDLPSGAPRVPLECHRHVGDLFRGRSNRRDHGAPRGAVARPPRPPVRVPCGGLLIAIGFVTSSFASALWQLMLLYAVVLTIGETIVSGFAISALLVPWFPRARGRVLGLVEAGNPVGTLLLVSLAHLLVSTLGWQETVRVLGLVFLLLLGPGNFFFLRRAPAETSVGGPTGSDPPGAMAAPDQPAADPTPRAPAGPTAAAGPTGEAKESGYLPWRQI